MSPSRARLVASHEPRVAGHIGDYDDTQSALLALQELLPHNLPGEMVGMEIDDSNFPWSRICSTQVSLSAHCPVMDCISILPATAINPVLAASTLNAFEWRQL